jgi:uncharacterized protein YneF (UPF0154 family)
MMDIALGVVLGAMAVLAGLTCYGVWIARNCEGADRCHRRHE